MTRTRMLYALVPAVIAGGVLVSSVTRADDDVDPWADRDDADATGTLTIATTPFAEVYIDGKAYGTTPHRGLQLPAGKHKITLVTPDGAKTTSVIVIEAGRHVKIARDLSTGASAGVGGGIDPFDHARHARDHARAQIDQARAQIDQARAQLDQARAQITSDSRIPPKLRDKILKRLDKATKSVDKRLGKLQLDGDWDSFGAEMEAFGEELGEAFADMEGDFDNLGDDVGRQIEAEVRRGLARKGIRIDINPGSDDEQVFVLPPVPPVPPVAPIPPVPPMPPAPGHSGIGVDMSDMDMAIDLDDLNLSAPQRQQLRSVIEAEQAAIRPAEQQLEHLSEQLRDELDSDDVDQARVDRYVDEMAAREAVIRKARLRAWADSRKLLNDQQRRHVLDHGRRRHVGP